MAVRSHLLFMFARNFFRKLESRLRKAWPSLIDEESLFWSSESNLGRCQMWRKKYHLCPHVMYWDLGDLTLFKCIMVSWSLACPKRGWLPLSRLHDSFKSRPYFAYAVVYARKLSKKKEKAVWVNSRNGLHYRVCWSHALGIVICCTVWAISMRNYIKKLGKEATKQGSKEG